MPVPNTIADLNPSAASNSPLGTDTVGPNLDDYLRSGFSFTRQIFDGTPFLLTSVAGSNTVTATCQVPFTAYTNGLTVRFVPAATNTGAVTLNINGIGAKAITKRGATALVPGDLVAGAVYEVTYDGTQFQLAGEANRVYARVIADTPAAQSVVNNTLVPILNWTERLDTTASFNPANGVFTAPRAGQYMVTGIFRIVTAAFPANTGLAAILTKNGTQHRSAGLVTAAAGAWSTQSAQLSCLVDLAQGDTIVLNAFQNSGATTTISTSSSDDVLTITEMP
ncbi:hypothetical protein K6V92_10220 [Cupriavidus respiraculi]|uniref:hypothetical protein n=1 Tax=Cupriavidus respiraculi TaxID=195930 RepID=UPI001C96B743|nr:hypothetical protein [Cupriavidus respiraculi]MBY4946993.1 hypothetical protein [Cupriavidus respiraculi]